MEIAVLPHVSPVPLHKAYLLLNHGPVTLVSSHSAGENNLMAAAWVMPLDFEPPKIAIVIDKNTRTRALIEKSGKFGINIPGRDQIKLIKLAGGISALASPEKWLALGCESLQGKQNETPLIEGCVAWLECEVIPEPHHQAMYDLFVAKVAFAWADCRQFRDERWLFDDASRRTIHYVAGGQFFETGLSIDN